MRTNAGYNIVREEVSHLDNGLNCYGVALGKKMTTLGPEWVTWEFQSNCNCARSYYWGHYFRDEQKAYIDFYERAIKMVKETSGWVKARKEEQYESSSSEN